MGLFCRAVQFSQSFFLVCSCRTHTGIRAVEEQPQNEDYRHPPGGGHQPEGQDPFGPAGAPGHCGAAIGKAVGDPAVGECAGFAAHLRTSRSVEEIAGEQHAAGEHEQQPQVEAGAVQFNRQVVGVGIALHGGGLS
jgi:hypothetical protein